MMKRLMEVEVYGQTFRLDSEDGEDHVRNVAALVDERMREISGSAKGTVPLRVAIMAAMRIADDLAKSSSGGSIQEENEALLEVESISERLLQGLEKADALGENVPGSTIADPKSSGNSSAKFRSEEKKLAPAAS